MSYSIPFYNSSRNYVHNTTLLFIILFSNLALFAAGCEGPCITGITSTLVSNYSKPVSSVWSHLSKELADNILPSRSTEEAKAILAPSRSLYKKHISEAIRQAEFPGYFHGKCQIDGVDPAGCPNPDCPVVCGTPGSIIHYYNHFVRISFNATAGLIADITTPDGDKKLTQFSKIEDRVMKQFFNESSVRLASPHRVQRRQNTRQTIHEELVRIFSTKHIHEGLEKQCGGKSLESCTWEAQGMKGYILSFP